ncbi:hypothetical protein DTO003C3_10318 [Penicillium roqueforti]|nr:hypothetical protein CBS147311_10278 [Penicillium roqueforti]KAI3273919.1 hypothetical protein DTO003C3_10318 [Penicillium roqueforti]
MTERTFTITGLIGCEVAQVLHRWARGSDSRGHGSSEVLGFAAPPLRDTVANAEPILRDTVVIAEPILRGTVANAEPILRDTVDNAEPILRSTVDNAEPILRDTVVIAEPILRDTVDNAEPILRDTVDNAEPILRDTVVITEPILRGTVDNAEPILRSTILHRWARGSDSRGHGSSQARRQKRDTMTHRSVRTEVLIFLGWESGRFYIFSATSRPRNQLRSW